MATSSAWVARHGFRLFLVPIRLFSSEPYCVITCCSADSVEVSYRALLSPGPNMLLLGGSKGNIQPLTNIELSGGEWGSGALVNNVAPIFQNSVFSGTTTGAAASFGAFLQQTDNSSNVSNGIGLTENLYLNGPGVVGHRQGAQVTVNILAATGNVQGQDYVAIGSKCNLMATDAGGNSVCFGNNPVAHIGQDVVTRGVVGEEIDTWVESGARVMDRIGEQIVDVMGSTYGTQAVRDDVSLSLNNQYNPTDTLGFKIGLEFGRWGGSFPVATNGTLIYGQGNQASGFTVANGIDFHLGKFTGNAYNDGHVVITGAGNVGIGTENPNTPLHIYSSGSGIVAALQNASGLCTFRPSTSSVITSCSSDIRLKRDIVDTHNVLDYFADMRVRDFTVKSTGERKTGVIAQEMLKEHPELVHMASNNYYTVDEPDPWKLVKAIQELKADNDTLRAEFESYKKAHP